MDGALGGPASTTSAPTQDRAISMGNIHQSFPRPVPPPYVSGASSRFPASES